MLNLLLVGSNPGLIRLEIIRAHLYTALSAVRAGGLLAITLSN